MIYRFAGIVLAAAFAPSLVAQEPAPGKQGLQDAFPGRGYSPYAGRKFATMPLWGDTHLHTSASFDAGSFGCRLGAADAYRFAKGEEVTSSTGQRVRLGRPLDFLVVADHSDNFGLFPRILGRHPDVMADAEGRRIVGMIEQGGQHAVEAAVELIDRFSRGTLPAALSVPPRSRAYRSAWDDHIRAAEDANDPGEFTALIGYEWTSNTGGNNLHRVVIYRDGADRAGRLEPFTTVSPLGSDNPRALWAWMETYEAQTGGQILAIAHNGNLSNGIMFPEIESFTGKPIDVEYAESRLRWEPLYEATQIKGDGEAHPFLSPNDEFADYETWDKANLNLSVPKQNSMLQYEYARSALKLGLELEGRLGVNPYEFGLIGSTDSHTALATAEEENFFGKHTGCEPGPERIVHPVATFGEVSLLGWEQASSGYAAVWAHENTREAIFDAMLRRETYATTGSRIWVRFFGGWNFEPEDAQSRTPAEIGYSKGAPMGGALRDPPDGASPSFLVAAMRDPMGANLDRLQIVKGWLDASGELHERVYDVAWSDGREPGADGRLPPVGNTVDVEAASWSNSIGAPELITVWKDPEFDPGERAFYYARAIEIPTPRWTTYEAKRYGLELPPEVPRTTQERAYTSPIWYRSAK